MTERGVDAYLVGRLKGGVITCKKKGRDLVPGDIIERHDGVWVKLLRVSEGLILNCRCVEWGGRRADWGHVPNDDEIEYRR